MKRVPRIITIIVAVGGVAVFLMVAHTIQTMGEQIVFIVAAVIPTEVILRMILEAHLTPAVRALHLTRGPVQAARVLVVVAAAAVAETNYRIC